MWLPKAIACFQTRTHRNAELLILADGQDVRDLLPDDRNIRLIHLESVLTIGHKRNFGCERAAGDIVAHWDDDDYSDAGRLADQLQRMDETGKSVTGYHSMRFTDGPNWWQYAGTHDYSLGTSLCYRREWWRAHPFEPIQVGEDNRFVMEAALAGQLATADAGQFMYASIHEGNTSPRTMGSSWIKLSGGKQ